MSYFLSVIIVFFCMGCFHKPNEKPSSETSEITTSPGVSFEGETVIERMFPLEEPEVSPGEPSMEEAIPNVEPEPESESTEDTEDTTAAIPMQPNRKFAADASVSVLLPKTGDLVPQVAVYVARLEKNLDDLDGTPRFVEDADVLYRDANTLALIALALGLSKEDNPYKKAAPAIIQAAMKMETVKKFDDAARVIAEIKQSLKAEADPTTLSWDKKIVTLKPIMKAVPNINTLVKRNLRTEAALKKGTRTVAEGSAVMAVIGQGSIPNVVETIKPDAVKEWNAHCLEFRDAALALNRAAADYEAEKGKFDTVQNAYEALSDSCDSCHKLFYHGEVPKE